ncbi:hypothetical protein BHM03_00060400 [Ensete ventricosum]|uniref:Uncharacterized protein n=1 Tax=Ensete ventricosum TaxID=4639 RepID=A0A427BBQ7_ENSVE|nr:hypothetical protein B296_00001103 [Ensete ventricosum]RZS26975.1 hypothetical protein BHM03_00060400 [Ensete ventricosum]
MQRGTSNTDEGWQYRKKMEEKKVEEVIEERGRAKKEKNDLNVVRHLKLKKGPNTGIGCRLTSCKPSMDGMLKHKGTYEIISPEDIGLSRSNESGIVLGKLRYGL